MSKTLKNPSDRLTSAVATPRRSPRLAAMPKIVKNTETVKDSRNRFLVSLLGGAAIGGISLWSSVSLPFAIIGAACSSLFSFSMFHSAKPYIPYPQTHGTSEHAKAFHDGELAARSYTAHFNSIFRPRDWKYYDHFIGGMERGIHQEKVFQETGRYLKY